MPLPPSRLPQSRDAPSATGSALGPADLAAVARAAAILRDRTMSFEAEPRSSRTLVLVLIGLTIAAAGLLVVFRRHVLWALGLL